MKKITTTILILTTILIFAACKNSNIPTPQKALNYTDDQFRTLATARTEKDLTDSWGEPKTVGNERFWQVEQNGETRFLVAYIENGQVISIHSSKKFYITKIDSTLCTYGWNDYNEDNRQVAYMPTKDKFGNDIQAQPGDKFIFESDGMVFESYPAQLGDPYSVTSTGKFSDEKLKQITSNIEFPVVEAVE